MRQFHFNKNQHFCPTINVDKIWSLIPEDARASFAEKAKAGPDAAAPIIDVTRAVCGFVNV